MGIYLLYRPILQKQKQNPQNKQAKNPNQNKNTEVWKSLNNPSSFSPFRFKKEQLNFMISQTLPQL